MNERPLERLNYFNGQRLQAADLKLEQEYHIRVRRWLNRSLYTAGIASGLQVHKVVGAPKVRVTAGLALDVFGREIILLDDREEKVFGATANGKPVALYLTIRYAEDVLARQDACCTIASGSHETVAWGAPSRVTVEPVLEWTSDLPHENSGKVLLAYVTLGAGCREVSIVDRSIRRYIGAALAAKVRQFALEGEREVAAIPTTDPANPLRVKGRVSFHIRGRQPNSVTLYLKAREFSALYYTELGAHTHTLSVSGQTGESNPELNATRTSHAHPAGTLAAASANSDHGHGLQARKGYIGKSRLPIGAEDSENKGRAAFFLIERDWSIAVKFGLLDLGIAPETDVNVEDILDDTAGSITGGAHGHTVTGDTGLSTGPDLRHTHSITGSGGSDSTGAWNPNRPAVKARAGAPLGYVRDLRIAIDGNDRTTAIRDLIARTVPISESPLWTVLGDGTSGHPFADPAKDAVSIRLDYLPGVILDEGEHSIEFSVGLAPNQQANGGLVHYNLYVE